MIENKYERCSEPDDPNRCQARGGEGQCPFKAIPGAINCARHQGDNQFKKEQEKQKDMYRLAKWQARVAEFSEHDEVKSLRSEIGIARMLLEETVVRCKDSNELLMYSSKISDLVCKLEKLVSSCHRLEASTGMLLDKTAAIHLASVIVTIIGDYVPDPDVIDKISNEIVLAIVTKAPE
jgi:hypothetical protein